MVRDLYDFGVSPDDAMVWFVVVAKPGERSDGWMARDEDPDDGHCGAESRIADARKKLGARRRISRVMLRRAARAEHACSLKERLVGRGG